MARRRMAMADIKEILVHWEAGAGVSAIARTLGYSRPTVRKYVEAAKHVGLQRGMRSRNERQWDTLTQQAIARVAAQRPIGAAAAAIVPFHDYIAARLADVPLAVIHQRLRDELQLTASWGTFYRYVRAHFPEHPRRHPQPTMRHDDPPPGVEAQVDFLYIGRWFDPEAQRERRLYAFVMTLSMSRHMFVYPTLGEDGAAWLDAHVAAFEFFGGVPHRLVPDNLSAGIVRADRYDPRRNRAYGELTRYYGCLVDPSRVAHPKDKPRVERNVPYVRASCFRGRDFLSLPSMRAHAVHWAREVAGHRTHGTTGEQPLAVFTQLEQAALLPLPPQPWQRVAWTSAVVHADCHLQVKRVPYSVPFTYVGQRLDVRLTDATVEVYADTALVTAHARAQHGRVTRIEHDAPAAQAFLRATPDVCLQRAQAVGPATAQLVADVLALPLRYRLREAQAVVRLTDRFGTGLEAACAQALAVGDGRYRTVRGLLQRGLPTPEAELASVPVTTGAFLRGAAAFATTVEEVGAWQP